MARKNSQNRRILLLLIILFLASISYLALEASIYYEGQWQAVQGSGLQPRSQQEQDFQVTLPEVQSYPEKHWEVIREGRLFFEPRPVIQTPEKVEGSDQTPAIPKPEEPPKPTCPWRLQGVLYGSDSVAILANPESQESRTVKVGHKVGEFEVLEIANDYVLVQSPEAEFKLELGGK